MFREYAGRADLMPRNSLLIASLLLGVLMSSQAHGQLPPSSRFFRQFDMPFTDRELFLAFAVTEDGPTARERVRELREEVSALRDYYAEQTATASPPEDAVVVSLSIDTFAILANLADSTAKKVQAYMNSLWNPDDIDNRITYDHLGKRRDELRPVMQARLKELGLKLEDE